MPVTPLSTECRAVAARMRVFGACEGNTNYLRKLIYEDSASVAQLIPVLEAITPPVDQAAVQGLYKAAATCGTVGECSGNVGMWPLVQTAADALIVAVDLIDAAPADEERSARSRK